MLVRVLLIFLAAATVHGAGGRLISRFHLDLDDCDDIAANANYLYLACHSTHAPKTLPVGSQNSVTSFSQQLMIPGS